jgi:DNA-binding MarR family transcriptional regulator
VLATASSSASSSAADTPAVRLAVAIKRLRTRLREAAWSSGVELPIAQLAILKRLRDDGPTTAAALAAAEHVSHQAIAQNLAALRRGGLVRAAPDPRDGRKSLVRITPPGSRLFATAVAARDAWLAHAIAKTVPAGQRAALERTILLLERLADADRPAPPARP